MIVREVLANPALLNNFDYFNDAKDTVAWLLAIGTDEAIKLAVELDSRWLLYRTRRAAIWSG
jgi:hypothetical protein